MTYGNCTFKVFQNDLNFALNSVLGDYDDDFNRVRLSPQGFNLAKERPADCLMLVHSYVPPQQRDILAFHL
jgi:hypothetical protein